MTRPGNISSLSGIPRCQSTVVGVSFMLFFLQQWEVTEFFCKILQLFQSDNCFYFILIYFFSRKSYWNPSLENFKVNLKMKNPKPKAIVHIGLPEYCQIWKLETYWDAVYSVCSKMFKIFQTKHLRLILLNSNPISVNFEFYGLDH